MLRYLEGKDEVLRFPAPGQSSFTGLKDLVICRVLR
jgi:hypothetical protein